MQASRHYHTAEGVSVGFGLPEESCPHGRDSLLGHFMRRRATPRADGLDQTLAACHEGS